MTIKIVTDSTCDLPEAIIDKYGITVVPLYINVGKRSYLDGVELSREEFYAQLPTYDPFPTTAAPGLGRFRQVYEKLAAEGATTILSIHVSASLSATFNNARLAAQEIKNATVIVFDSQQLTMGLGFMVIAAVKAAAEGRSVEEIATLLEQQIPYTYIFAALNTLEFLKRSGRVSRAIAGLGSLLHIKPLVKVHAGEITVERVRTSSRANQRLLELLSEIAPLARVALLHSNAPAKARALGQKAESLLPPGDILSVEITPIIGSHVGPGGVGFACISQNPTMIFK